MDWRGEVSDNNGQKHNKIDNDGMLFAFSDAVFFFCCILFVASEVLSNLKLQMALYFNVIFAPVWILVLVFFLADTVIFFCTHNQCSLQILFSVLLLRRTLQIRYNHSNRRYFNRRNLTTLFRVRGKSKRQG